MKQTLLLMLLALTLQTAQAQDSLKLKFRSRGFLDAMPSGYGTDNVQGYYKVEDFRVGFKARYQRYELTADLGVTDQKVKFKDVLLNVHYKNTVLAIGNTFEPFSMDMMMNTADLRFNQSAASVMAFTTSRRLGVTVHHLYKGLYMATGLYTDNDINEVGDGQTNAYVSTSRLVWRLRDAGGRQLFHIGAAASFRTKESNTTEPPVVSLGSVGVTSMFPHGMMEAQVDHAGTKTRQLVELLYTSPRVMVQGEYFFNQYNRTGGLATYRPHGGYLQCAVLLRGRGFGYDYDYALPERPQSDKACELVLRIDHTDLNDAGAGIYGGEETDYSLGLNMYFNRYLAWKIGASYVDVGAHCNSFYTKDCFVVQTRLQYIF